MMDEIEQIVVTFDDVINDRASYVDVVFYNGEMQTVNLSDHEASIIKELVMATIAKG